mmetsp:Transcript_46924/g.69441  ORF Transcript_46924/g.69441 Transcript_46924/m.69441 type:complete len:222 (+) Transcript_46924:53-718(+)|eukprot:CAMPEP_0195521848 /NCGR_PEP_ID=MMETSP0794_2-20130614/19477_1 /TAXON_ID=515487 /ORGANISM="Stephanopyxis turris, Strain CCMP 815" /LENGTH=221 /DNA_ID=CAMNT_0040651479 /DNA_START=53 /DNA_END=721 /DNA_ORIENTATION=+
MLRTVLVLSIALVANAFHVPSSPAFSRRNTLLRKTQDDTNASVETEDVESVLAEMYPAFHSLVSKNENIWKTLGKSENGFTLFVPNAEAFEDLGDKKLLQIEDPRNLETVEKIGAYHVIPGEAVSAEIFKREDWTVPRTDGVAALKIGGVMTLGGELPVGRSKSGGFMGLGAKEDGSVVIGGSANIIKSFTVGKCLVHEVDALVSPQILWRYCDQLRIPGF